MRIGNTRQESRRIVMPAAHEQKPTKSNRFFQASELTVMVIVMVVAVSDHDMENVPSGDT